MQVEKSVEAMLLYLATLRAGHVFLPLNTAYQSAEVEYFVGNAEPAVVVCTPKNLDWVSRIATAAGAAHVFTLGDDRDGNLLERAAHCGDERRARGRRPILYTSGGPRKGAMLSIAPAVERPNLRTMVGAGRRVIPAIFHAPACSWPSIRPHGKIIGWVPQGRHCHARHRVLGALCALA